MLQESKGQLASVQFEVIAAKADVSVDLAKRIISDIFQELAGVSRRSHKEARLCFKDCGYLLVFKNREVVFQQALQMTTAGLAAERSQMRDEVSYIDYASAVLSSRGGKAFSVRSKKDSKVSSMAASKKMDPISRCSNSHSVRKPFRTIEASRNPPMQPPQTRPQNSHLQAFIDKQLGVRPGRRVFFETSDYQDVLGNYDRQIQQKMLRQGSEQRLGMELEAKQLELA